MLAGGAIVVTVLVVSAARTSPGRMLSRPSAEPEAVPEVQAEAAVSTKRPAGRRAETRTAAAGTPAPQPDPARTRRSGADSSGSAIAPRRGPVDLEVVGPQPVASSLPEVADCRRQHVRAGRPAPPASGTPLFVQDGPAEPVDLEDRVYSSADAAVVPATLAREQMLPPPMGVVQGVAAASDRAGRVGGRHGRARALPGAAAADAGHDAAEQREDVDVQSGAERRPAGAVTPRAVVVRRAVTGPGRCPRPPTPRRAARSRDS